MQGRSIEVVTANPLEEIIADVVSMVYSLCVRRYGQRRAKQKTEKLVQDLHVKTEQHRERSEQDATR
jgi:putative resolvase